MSLLNYLVERFYMHYGEKWSHVSKEDECKKRISEFFKYHSSPILAYISIQSVFFQEFKKEFKKYKGKKEIIYHNKPITFIVRNKNAVLSEDGSQLFGKCYTEILGKKLTELFNSKPQGKSAS